MKHLILSLLTVLFFPLLIFIRSLDKYFYGGRDLKLLKIGIRQISALGMVNNGDEIEKILNQAQNGCPYSQYAIGKEFYSYLNTLMHQLRQIEGVISRKERML